MQAAVRKLGNSAGVIIPKSILAQLRLSAGDTVDMRLEDGRLILLPIRQTKRAGWAEASQAVAVFRAKTRWYGLSSAIWMMPI
jgi:antitoxin MazE